MLYLLVILFSGNLIFILENFISKAAWMSSGMKLVDCNSALYAIKISTWLVQIYLKMNCRISNLRSLGCGGNYHHNILWGLSWNYIHPFNINKTIAYLRQWFISPLQIICLGTSHTYLNGPIIFQNGLQIPLPSCFSVFILLLLPA